MNYINLIYISIYTYTLKDRESTFHPRNSCRGAERPMDATAKQRRMDQARAVDHPDLDGC